MKLIPDFISRRFARQQNLTWADLAKMWDGPETGSGMHVSPDTAMRCATVFACVRVLAESVAQLPLLVYREDAKGNKERDKKHPLYWLLNVQPNPWQTAFEFREMMMGHCILRGNAYAWKNRLGSGKIAELMPLHPAKMTVTQQPDWSLQYRYNGKEMNPADVLHIRGLSVNGYSGVSAIEYAREAVGLAFATEKAGASMFKNGVHAKGALKHPANLPPETVAQLSESFSKAYAGSANAGKPPLLQGGLEWVNIGMSYQDAQYLETRKFQRTEICSIFRVPPHMIGDLERATFSNIEQQSIEFVTRSLMPWLRRFEQVVTRDLIGERDQGGVYVEHLADALLRGDTLSRYQAYGQGIRDGWISRNEVRSRENLNKADGLDEFLQPLNMQTLSQQTAAMEQENAALKQQAAASQQQGAPEQGK